jgi:hypothetical protein
MMDERNRLGEHTKKPLHGGSKKSARSASLSQRKCAVMRLGGEALFLMFLPAVTELSYASYSHLIATIL